MSGVAAWRRETRAQKRNGLRIELRPIPEGAEITCPEPVRVTVSVGSSLTIVPTACPPPAPIVAFVGRDSVTRNVSSGSIAPSPWTGTAIVCVACCRAKVSVPEAAV